MQLTVGENINGVNKLRNNYGAIKLIIFSIGPCKVIALLCLILGITSMILSSISLSIVIAIEIIVTISRF